MKISYRFLFPVFLIAVGAFLLQTFKQVEVPIYGIEISEKVFRTESVSAIATRSQGLMYREHLGADQGMLFILPQNKKYSFWMKNMLIPLDIVWIDENLKVIGVDTVQPCSEQLSFEDNCPLISPPSKIKYALEVNAGACTECQGLVKFKY